jgi:hypothetical protein
MDFKEKHPKVEAHIREVIKKDKAWAEQKVAEVGREWPGASEMSKKMLNEYLDKTEDELLESRYPYFKMRAHAFGDGNGIAIDPQAQALWEKLTGETISHK